VAHKFNHQIKNQIMAVLISTKVKGQTLEGYNSVLSAVRELVKQAPGFIMHCAHPAEGAWDVYEVWQSKAEADSWFAKYVVPNLPSGIHPKRSYQELHSVVTRFE
jgi:antibiotic biosynthesis monooxygenase (ABM) superfamily enzyme